MPVSILPRRITWCWRRVACRPNCLLVLAMCCPPIVNPITGRPDQRIGASGRGCVCRERTREEARNNRVPIKLQFHTLKRVGSRYHLRYFVVVLLSPSPNLDVTFSSQALRRDFDPTLQRVWADWVVSEANGQWILVEASVVRVLGVNALKTLRDRGGDTLL